MFDATVYLIHDDRGTLTCRLAGTEGKSALLETPLIRAETGTHLRVGIRAGDILLATVKPVGLSARNVLAGHLVSLERRDMMISVRVDCGVEMQVYVTLAARDALELAAGKKVWLVIKTHSCHLMRVINSSHFSVHSSQ
jgi:molybdate transport system ATP-binding protein